MQIDCRTTTGSRSRLARRATVVFSTAAALALTVAAVAVAAGTDQEQVQLTPAGQAAAKGAILRLADIGAGFTGGAVAPDESSTPDCANYHPKQSDLVKNGDAASSFSLKGVSISSEASVLASAAMVRTDWQRTIRPELMSCLRTVFTRSLGTGGSRVVSVSDLSFPHVTTYAHGYRAVLQVVKGDTSTRVVSDFILLGRGRTEITLNLTSLPNAAALATEVAIAKKLVARISA